MKKKGGRRKEGREEGKGRKEVGKGRKKGREGRGGEGGREGGDKRPLGSESAEDRTVLEREESALASSGICSLSPKSVCGLQARLLPL